VAVDVVRQFLDDAGQDEVLQDELGRAVTGAADRFAALAQVAARYGYEVTAADVRASVGGMADSAGLSEDNY